MNFRVSFNRGKFNGRRGGGGGGGGREWVEGGVPLKFKVHFSYFCTSKFYLNGSMRSNHCLHGHH